MFRKGLLIVFSGPSGAGKGTLLKSVTTINKNIGFSVSATTRSPREGEVNGKNYFFISVDQFKSMIENNMLVEWVEYCGNYYGTPRKYVEDTLEAGIDVILEIEVEGAANIIKQYPDCVPIFVLPPSFEELRKRIEGRGTEKQDVIEKRLERAKKEMNYIKNYKYVVINDDIERAANDMNCILRSEKLKIKHNTNILKDLGIDIGRENNVND
ncbi:MAG: guanylate kinase [Bacillota bacterium]|nr:guanylate kinase [Bacillota bacterium]